MAASPAKLRSLYRSFLRELPPRRLLASPRSPLHAQLRSAFEPQAASAASPTSVFHGEQYLAYLQAQRTYSMLLERYNPGMAANMDDTERVRLTARRVGMNLPVEFEEGGGENTGKK